MGMHLALSGLCYRKNRLVILQSARCHRVQLHERSRQWLLLLVRLGYLRCGAWREQVQHPKTWESTDVTHIAVARAHEYDMCNVGAVNDGSVLNVESDRCCIFCSGHMHSWTTRPCIRSRDSFSVKSCLVQHARCVGMLCLRCSSRE